MVQAHVLLKQPAINALTDKHWPSYNNVQLFMRNNVAPEEEMARSSVAHAKMNSGGLWRW